MSKFRDSLGREWKLDITVATLRRAKRNDIDLSMPVSQMQSYVMDDVFLTDALWIVIEPNAGEFTLEQFEAGLNGKVLAVAREALWDALYEYFDPGKAEMLRAAVASVAGEVAKATKLLTSTGSTRSKGSSDTTSALTE